MGLGFGPPAILPPFIDLNPSRQGATIMRTSRIAIALVGIAAATWSGIGRAQEGPAEKTGGALDSAGRAIKRGVQGAGESIREGFSATKTKVNNMSLESRIYGRLHWDKDLTDSMIELEVQAGGIAVLRGNVMDTAAKTKAVALARDTVGVTSVVDQLAVAPPARVVPAQPAGAAPRR